VQFARQFTTTAGGVGAVCSLSAFDFAKHGNGRYGAPRTARKQSRSKQGKMEKSFLSFTARYPTWEPGESGREFLRNVRRFAEETQRASSRGESPSQNEEGAEKRRALFASPNARGGGVGEISGRFPSPDGGSVFGGVHDADEFYDAEGDASNTRSKIGFFGHGRVFDAGGGEGERGDGRVFGAPDERREAQTQALLQRAYESRAFETESPESRHTYPSSRVSLSSHSESRVPSLESAEYARRVETARDSPFAPDSKRRGPAETEMSVSVSVSPPARPAPPLFDAPPNLWELEAEEDPPGKR
jgi:hypothetical protein